MLHWVAFIAGTMGRDGRHSMYGFKKDGVGLKVTQASPREFRFLPVTVLLVLEFTVCLHLVETVGTSLRQTCMVPHKPLVHPGTQTVTSGPPSSFLALTLFLFLVMPCSSKMAAAAPACLPSEHSPHRAGST